MRTVGAGEVGANVGTSVGPVGLKVGSAVGIVGERVGAAVGVTVGVDGVRVRGDGGTTVGEIELGCAEVGIMVGWALTAKVPFRVGDSVGVSTSDILRSFDSDKPISPLALTKLINKLSFPMLSNRRLF